MLPCVIFGALASVAVAIYALLQGHSFESALNLYLIVSLSSIIGVPLLCAARRRVVRWLQHSRDHAST